MNGSVRYFLHCVQNTICVFMFVLMVRNNDEKINIQIFVFLFFQEKLFLLFDYFELIQIDCLKSEVVIKLYLLEKVSNNRLEILNSKKIFQPKSFSDLK